MGDQEMKQNLTRRKSQDMQNSQVKVKVEEQQVHTPVPASSLKSRFNDAEYERWSEKIRSRHGSKNK
jgi:hypothetical protein